jgi:hypothetical protein
MINAVQQQNGTVQSGATPNCTTTFANAQGTGTGTSTNIIEIIYGDLGGVPNSGSILSVTDSQGNVYHKVCDFDDNVGTNEQLGLFVAFNVKPCGAGANTVTATFDRNIGSGFAVVALNEFDGGLNFIVPQTGGVLFFGNHGTGTSGTTTALATKWPGSLAFELWDGDNTFSVSAPWTETLSNRAYAQLSNTATVTPTVAQAPSGNWVMVAAAFASVRDTLFFNQL